MKRSYVVLVSSLLVLTLFITGCGVGQVSVNSGSTPPPASDQSALTPTPTVQSIAVAATTAPAAPPATAGQAGTTPVSAPPPLTPVPMTAVTPVPAAAQATSVLPLPKAVTTAVIVTPAPDWAALVNGQPVLKKDYERQFQLAKSAMESRGQDLKSEDGKKVLVVVQQQVLEDMINLAIIQQVAGTQGISVTQKAVDASAEKSIKDGGGRQGFDKWLKDTQQTESDYKGMIRMQLLTEGIGDKLAGTLPDTAPQVHARHILFAKEEDAQKALKELKSGGDFAALAKKYSIDQNTKDKGGDLGWFPRNMMSPDIDAVAFSLEPKQMSAVVKDSFGTFHILQVLEKDQNRKLSDEVRNSLSASAFMRWISEQRLSADIQRFMEFK